MGKPSSLGVRFLLPALTTGRVLDVGAADTANSCCQKRKWMFRKAALQEGSDIWTVIQISWLIVQSGNYRSDRYIQHSMVAKNGEGLVQI